MIGDGKVFQVIESCAGLRSLETLLMSAVVYCEIFHRRGTRAMLLIFAAPLLGLLVNQLRVLSIALNPYSDLAAIHTSQGIAMLVAGVLVMAGLDAVLGRVLPDHLKFARSSLPTADWDRYTGSGQAIWRAAVVFGLFMVLGVSSLLLPPWSTKPPRPTPLFSLSPRLGDWRAGGLPLDEQFIGSVGFTEWVHRTYSRGDREVAVFLGSDNRLEPRMSLISRKTALPGPGHTLVSESEVELQPDGRIAHRLLLRAPRGLVLVYHWYEGVDSFAVELLRSTFVLDRGPLRRGGRAIAVRVSTRLPRKRSQWGVAESALIEVVGLLREELAKLAASPVAGSS
jgi:exosortase/archaeosortase family protein